MKHNKEQILKELYNQDMDKRKMSLMPLLNEFKYKINIDISKLTKKQDNCFSFKN